MRIDMSEVRALAADMRGVRGRLEPKVKGVMSKGALKIKQGMQNDLLENSRGGGTHQRVAADVSYDFIDAFRVEVGPTLGDAGSLQLLYFGNSKSGPTTPDPMRLARKESNSIARYLADAAQESVW